MSRSRSNFTALKPLGTFSTAAQYALNVRCGEGHDGAPGAHTHEYSASPTQRPTLVKSSHPHGFAPPNAEHPFDPLFCAA